ncbi:hypothetical protein ABER98_21270 [Domibacillus aminovorans]|uniref:hypothetical protein n=1 Tax=Domibacillus aminovorans TaxID=29332 RepID=UPI003D219962
MKRIEFTFDIPYVVIWLSKSHDDFKARVKSHFFQVHPELKFLRIQGKQVVLTKEEGKGGGNDGNRKRSR